MNIQLRNILIAAIVLVLLGAFLYYFSSIVLIVLIAWVLSLLGQPIMIFLIKRLRIGKKYRAGRNVASVLTLIFFILCLASIFLLFVPLVISQARNLSEVNFAQTLVSLEKPIFQLETWLKAKHLLAANKTIITELEGAAKSFYDPSVIGNFLGSAVKGVGNLFFILSSSLFIAFFFLKDSSMFTNFLIDILPAQYEERIKVAIEDISRMLTKYFGAIVLQMLFFSIFISIGLSIVGAKNAVIIGVVAAFMNIIPYLGPFLGSIFAAFITVSSNLDLDFYNQMMPLLIKVLLVFPIVQFIDNMIVQPYIFSNSVSAHPIEIFLVTLMGAQIGGVGGMVLAIPAYTVFRVVAKVFWSEYKIVRAFTDNLNVEKD